MRVTVRVPDKIVGELRTQAANEQRSISSPVAESIEYYIRERTRKNAPQNLIQLAGKVTVDQNVLKTLEEERGADDRS
jgi:hypothetical protein